jgi:hypothetical protein
MHFLQLEKVFSSTWEEEEAEVSVPSCLIWVWVEEEEQFSDDRTGNQNSQLNYDVSTHYLEHVAREVVQIEVISSSWTLCLPGVTPQHCLRLTRFPC